jgi:hypothetical protein
MATRLLPAKTGKADAETLSRVVPMQKPPRRANLSVPLGLLSATRSASRRGGPTSRDASCASRARPGTATFPGDRLCLALIPVQRSSDDPSSPPKFTRSGVLTPSHTLETHFLYRSAPARARRPAPLSAHGCTIRPCVRYSTSSSPANAPAAVLLPLSGAPTAPPRWPSSRRPARAWPTRTPWPRTRARPGERCWPTRRKADTNCPRSSARR